MANQLTKSSVYFPNLNSVRFIAAFLVIIHHIDQFKGLFKVPGYVAPNYLDTNFVLKAGPLGVMLFFTLSGFLITYLLLTEKQITGTISIKNFYIRRVLRIWPLYFLVVFTALFLYPHMPFLNSPVLYSPAFYNHFALKLLLFIFILPNLVLTLFPPIPFCAQTWSIGAEEQFYLVWPMLVKFSKNTFVMVVAVITIYFIATHSLKMISKHAPSNYTLSAISDFVESIHIDIMAIGAFFALVGFSKHKVYVQIKKALFHKWFQATIILLTIFVMARGIHVPVINFEFYAILFGIIILNLALNEKNILKLEYPVLNYLGKISYGLYMFHTVAIVFSIKFLLRTGMFNDLCLYTLAVLLTILLSSISYYFFEKPIISKKIRFSAVISGDNIEEPTTTNYTSNSGTK